MAGSGTVGPEEARGHDNGAFDLRVRLVFVVDGAEKAFAAWRGVAGVAFPIWENVAEKFIFD